MWSTHFEQVFFFFNFRLCRTFLRLHAIILLSILPTSLILRLLLKLCNINSISPTFTMPPNSTRAITSTASKRSVRSKPSPAQSIKSIRCRSTNSVSCAFISYEVSSHNTYYDRQSLIYRHCLCLQDRCLMVV
jgi:hypothetical protein